MFYLINTFELLHMNQRVKSQALPRSHVMSFKASSSHLSDNNFNVKDFLPYFVFQPKIDALVPKPKIRRI